MCGKTNKAAKSSGAPPENSREAPPSHGLELVDALLRVALPDLTQRFVFVSARLHVLGVQHVVLRLLGFISGLGQL